MMAGERGKEEGRTWSMEKEGNEGGRREKRGIGKQILREAGENEAEKKET